MSDGAALPLTPGVLEGQTLENDVEVAADVCIVGSGPGGASVAARVAEAGLSVVVVDEGGYFTSQRFRMQEAEAFTHLYMDGGKRTTKDLAISILQGRAVGGGTVVNWTTSLRLPETTFELWQRRHAVGGVTYEELSRAWDVVEKDLNVARIDPSLLNRNNRILYDGCRALGWEVECVPRNVRGCAHTGYCGMGCPIDAKQSTLLTYLPRAMDRGAMVISRARADRLEYEGDNVRALRCTLLDATGTASTGRLLTVRAERFVLAAGAIGTPAILLRSGAPDPHRRLGRRTFLHPVVVASGIFDEPVNPFYGAPQGAASHEFAHRGEKVGFFLETAPVHPALAASALPGFGHAHRRLMKALPFVTGHLALAVDGHHDHTPGGVVELDDFGRPVLDYPLTPSLFEAFREAHRRIVTLQLEQGARRVYTMHDPPRPIRSRAELSILDELPYASNRLFVTTAHQMGGAGMSDAPESGVVRSEDLRHHQLTNLHVVDGSVFPTSLGVNPQLTIFGLAHVMAARLADAWT